MEIFIGAQGRQTGQRCKIKIYMAKKTKNRLGERTRIDTATNEVIGMETGKIYAKATSLAEALAVQTQISTGSAPTISGRPDLFAVAPTSTQKVEEFVEPKTGKKITPRVATGEELKQAEAQTLPSYYAARGTPGTISPEQEIINGVEQTVSGKEAAALAENPSLEVTKEMRAEWLKQAWDEINANGYYQELIRSYELSTGTTLNRLVEDVRATETGLKTQYGRQLAETQTGLRERGLLYGGVREKTEAELAEEYNRQLEELGRQFTRGIEDTSLSAEQYLGTEAAQTFGGGLGTTQTVGRVIAGTPVFESGEDTSLFKSISGFTGEVPRAKTEEAYTRAGELEERFRDIISAYY